MRRLFPAPLLSAALFLLWLLLAQSASAGNVLLGALLAIVCPAVTARLRPAPVRIRRPLVAVRLALQVVSDMFVSALRVFRVVLTVRSDNLGSGFASVPLELRDPNGLAALAAIVTLTPGTAWAQLSADRSRLLIHVLELKDEQGFVKMVKDRYERPLREIFE